MVFHNTQRFWRISFGSFTNTIVDIERSLVQWSSCYRSEHSESRCFARTAYFAQRHRENKETGQRFSFLARHIWTCAKYGRKIHGLFRYSANLVKESMMSIAIPNLPFGINSMDVFEIDTMNDGFMQKRNFLLTVDHYSNFFELDEMDNLRKETVVEICEWILHDMAFQIWLFAITKHTLETKIFQQWPWIGNLGYKRRLHITPNLM